jgi:tetratricopeptide (TPR) repeat protein
MTWPPTRQGRQLIGREAQLAVVDGHLADLERGHGGLLVLAGEAGIGKTRLAEEIVARSRERGAKPVWATAWTAADGAPPLWPWSQALLQLVGTADALDQPGPESPAESTAARFAQFNSIAREILAAAEREPIVMVIDDLHWADAASIRLLSFVAVAVRRSPCLLVATYRADELHRDVVAELARVGTTLAVPPLSDDAARELLAAAVGADVGNVASDAVVARSNGNPLFVWEFGQLMAHSGRTDVAPAAIPDAVASVIERRLARLAEPHVTILRVAAVAGDPVSAALLASIGDVSIEDVVGALHAASAAGLVVGSELAGSHSFSHALVRDVVLDGIEPVARAALHHRTAAELARRAEVDESLHRVVAHHLSQAGPAMASAASEHWERAGHAALRVLAYEDATVCFDNAAQASATDPRRAAGLLIAQGEASLLAGDLERAREQFTAAAAQARALGEPELFARAVLGIGTGAVGWEVPLGSEEQAAMVADALALLPGDEPRLRSMLLARLSVTAATPETVGVARERAEQALDLAREVGDPALIGQALAALNDAIGGPTHVMERRDNADTIVELAGDAGDRALELLGHRFRVVADLELGDFSAVDRDIAAFSRLADQLRQPLVSWYVPLFRGMRALLAGDVAAADRCQEEVAAAAVATGSSNAAMLATTLRMGIDVAAERAVPADLLENLFEVDPAAWSTMAAGLAMSNLAGGELDRAGEVLRLHSGNDFRRLGDDSEKLVTLMMFGRVAVGVGDRDAAQRIYELLAPHAGLWTVDGIAACCWAPVDLELARLAIALDRAAEAIPHLARARQAVEGAGATLLVAEVGRLEAQVGGRSRATAAAPGEPGLAPANVFRHEGPFWTIAYRDRTVRMRDAKGLHDLARLLAEPDRELHVLGLASTGALQPDRATGGAVDTADVGELLDAQARADYRRRLAELEDELAEAEANNDVGRADKARAERDFIAHELAAALGLGGRPRKAGDPTERARKAVTARIRMAIGRIDQEHPALARHLTNAVRTGTYCAYAPEAPTPWEV